MRAWKFLSAVPIAAVLLLTPARPATAQIAVQIGPAPECPYGYYEVPPYNCAPYGYYGPEWFNGGIFVGAGPWFHGPRDFHGRVDHHLDYRHGYHGPLPHRGDHPEAARHEDFHGHAMHDPHGHEYHPR
jgi:hypothetical protein